MGKEKPAGHEPAPSPFIVWMHPDSAEDFSTPATSGGQGLFPAQPVAGPSARRASVPLITKNNLLAPRKAWVRTSAHSDRRACPCRVYCLQRNAPNVVARCSALPHFWARFICVTGAMPKIRSMTSSGGSAANSSRPHPRARRINEMRGAGHSGRLIRRK